MVVGRVAEMMANHLCLRSYQERIGIELNHMCVCSWDYETKDYIEGTMRGNVGLKDLTPKGNNFEWIWGQLKLRWGTKIRDILGGRDWRCCSSGGTAA
jgi:hypothetical protein